MSMTKINNKNIWMMATITAALSFMLMSGTTTMQQAFAHASTTLTLEEEPVEGKKIRVVLGHTNEPTYGAKPGIHDGKHHMEVFLSDSDTRLPLSGASLKADKYYFKDIKSFNKAETLDDADDIEKGVTVGSVFGDPGHYMTRQVQKDGIYGYRLYGTINYFGEATMKIDTVVFCSLGGEGGGSSTTKFNSPGWRGGYGCTEDIDDILFPEKNNDVNPTKGNSKASLELGADSAQVQQAGFDSDRVAQSTTLNTVAASSTTPSGAAVQQAGSPAIGLQLLMFGLPAAAVAGYVGIRTLRSHKRDQAL